MTPVQTVCLTTAYLAPIQYYAKFLGNEVLIEQHEHYQKQSYRTRCDIYAANGRLPLSIPVKKVHGEKMPITDVQIEYDKNWQAIHWRSIESAYRTSPFFEYYEDDFRPFFEEKERFLFDFNTKLTQLVLELIGIKNAPQFTTEYHKEIHGLDYRQSITPKKNFDDDSCFTATPYYQVFEQQHGFLPNLSIIDLLFNEGPNSICILEDSVCKQTAN